MAARLTSYMSYKFYSGQHVKIVEVCRQDGPFWDPSLHDVNRCLYGNPTLGGTSDVLRACLLCASHGRFTSSAEGYKPKA